MSKPTLEEYENAKQEYSTFCSWIQLARERKNKLIDELSNVRKDELLYLDLAEKYKETIHTYEVYEEIERGESGDR